MRLILAALMLFAAERLHAVETASFLAIGPGARGLAMGSAFTALSDGADSLYWNPAGLARMEKSEVVADDTELPQSARLNDVYLAMPTKYGTFGAGAAYYSQGGLAGRDALGRPTNGFGVSNGDGELGWALKSALVDVGAAVEFVSVNLGGSHASTVAFDAGLRRAFGALTVAASIRNAGPGLNLDGETDDLPLRLAVGSAYALPGGNAITAEYVDGPHGAGSSVAAGAEAQVIKGVFFRVGFTSQSAATGGTGFNAVDGITFGFGLRRPNWSLDYAALPQGELGSAQRFSASYRW